MFKGEDRVLTTEPELERGGVGNACVCLQWWGVVREGRDCQLSLSRRVELLGALD